LLRSTSPVVYDGVNCPRYFQIGGPFTGLLAARLEPLFALQLAMSRNYYSEINLHLIWHAKNSLPLLTSEIEPLTQRFLKKRIIETPGAFFHEIGGIETHVHVVLTVQPTLLISEFIGQLKGGSSQGVNQAMGRGQKVLEWQNGYGVVSFGTRDLPWVIEYVRSQREHHARGTIHERLERIAQEEPEMAQAVTARRAVNWPA
jgi:REP-associated tyrosine transposase